VNGMVFEDARELVLPFLKVEENFERSKAAHDRG
jgi:hypothetical protein